MTPTHSPLVGLRSFITFCKPYRLKILASFTLTVIAEILLAIMPIFVGKLIETISKQPLDINTAWIYVICLIACASLHDVAWRSAEFFYRAKLNIVSFNYEVLLFQNILTKPYAYFIDTFTGKIASYVMMLSDEFRNFLEDVCFRYSGNIVGITITLIIMTSINWQTGLIYLIGIIGMILLGQYTLRGDMKYQKISTDARSTKNGYLFDAIANFSSVKMFEKELYETERLQKSENVAYKKGQISSLWSIFFWGSMSLFIRHVIWPLTILTNFILYLHGSLTIGQLTTILSSSLLFSSTIWETIWQVSQLGNRIARTNEAHTYLFGNEFPKALTPPTHNQETVTLKDRIEINNLSFAYPDQADVEVLKNITLTIKQGEKIGIVGRSGSGKSTLVKILLNSYEAPNDTILFDGKSIRGSDLPHLISFVPQDTTLFHRSIADNIAYAASGHISRQAIIDAAKKAEADEFIRELELNYDTLVGERGVKLSGGQRQRIAIARAILKDAPILILDEATSALDSESEKYIQESLRELMKHRTSIVIAHRLSTIATLDRIIVMDKGSIVEEGSHKELLNQQGMYATLWKHQSGGFIEE